MWQEPCQQKFVFSEGMQYCQYEDACNVCTSKASRRTATGKLWSDFPLRDGRSASAGMHSVYAIKASMRKQTADAEISYDSRQARCDHRVAKPVRKILRCEKQTVGAH